MHPCLLPYEGYDILKIKSFVKLQKLTFSQNENYKIFLKIVSKSADDIDKCTCVLNSGFDIMKCLIDYMTNTIFNPLLN